MLAIRDVSAGYEAGNVLHSVDVSAQAGELTVILGANGAGKTTLFRTISGILKPTSGDIEFNGSAITRRTANSIVKSGLAQCPEGRRLFPKMPVEKNLILGAYVHRRNRARIHELLDRVYELFPVLRDKRQLPAGSLSGGQQQMAAIGRALLSDPKMLILDEPSMGLAPLVTKQVLDAITQINRDGVGVLLAEQNAKAALRIAHHGFVIAEGRIALSGTADQLLDDPEVQHSYLGM